MKQRLDTHWEYKKDHQYHNPAFSEMGVDEDRFLSMPGVKLYSSMLNEATRSWNRLDSDDGDSRSKIPLARTVQCLVLIAHNPVELNRSSFAQIGQFNPSIQVTTSKERRTKIVWALAIGKITYFAGGTHRFKTGWVSNAIYLAWYISRLVHIVPLNICISRLVTLNLHDLWSCTKTI